MQPKMTMMKRSKDSLSDALRHINRKRLNQLLIELVNQYSPSFAEAAATQTLAQAFEKAGISYEYQPVSSKRKEEKRHNLIIRLGPSPATLLFVGHVDTIDLWHEGSHEARLEGDRLFGLGATDMKGGCVAILEAILAINQAGLPLKKGLGAAFVVGEEHSGDGSKALKEIEIADAPLILIGEPTNLAPCISHYSYLELRLSGKGLRAHAALPEVGANAIHAVLDWILQILNKSQKQHFADRLSVNPREIEGGEPSFVVPESCEAYIDIHFPPEVHDVEISAIIEKAQTTVSESHRDVELSFEELLWAKGFVHDENDVRLFPIRKAYDTLGIDWNPGVFRSHSDACLLKSDNNLPLLCGPGDLSVAHRRDEFVSLSEVENAARLYTVIIHETCLVD